MTRHEQDATRTIMQEIQRLQEALKRLLSQIEVSEAVREVGGSIVILPLAGSLSTSSVIDRIMALASEATNSQTGVER